MPDLDMKISAAFPAARVFAGLPALRARPDAALLPRLRHQTTQT